MPRFSCSSWPNQRDHPGPSLGFLSQVFQQTLNSLAAKIWHMRGDHRIVVIRLWRSCLNVDVSDTRFLQPARAPVTPVSLTFSHRIVEGLSAFLGNSRLVGNHVDAI